MIRHIAMFRWKPDVVPEQVAELTEELRRLPEIISEIESYQVGTDAGITEGGADFAVVADFARPADYFAYRDHPEHRRIIADLVRPMAEEVYRIQMEL